eukprot:scaffold11946_cov60-Phaeocystis_antarctica.AAC.2
MQIAKGQAASCLACSASSPVQPQPAAAATQKLGLGPALRAGAPVRRHRAARRGLATMVAHATGPSDDKWTRGRTLCPAKARGSSPTVLGWGSASATQCVTVCPARACLTSSSWDRPCPSCPCRPLARPPPSQACAPP